MLTDFVMIAAVRGEQEREEDGILHQERAGAGGEPGGWAQSARE